MFRQSFGAGLLVLALYAPALAQVQPIAPLMPIGSVGQAPQSAGAPLPPLVPVTPVQTLLNQTYRAVQSAGGGNQTLAARIAYAQALSHYREGDRAGAASYAAWALAQLPAAIAPLTIAPIAAAAPPPSSLTPLIGDGAALPPYISRARDAVLDAHFADARSRDRALASIRAAVDAWLDGNAAQAMRATADAQALAAGKPAP